jgi:hypothetical protein
MEIQGNKLTARLRLAGTFIFLGLLVEALTLTWNNPIAFLVFMGVGGLLIFLGLVTYLLSLVSPVPDANTNS